MPDAPVRVFVSHSSKDREFALRLEASLEARDIQAWLDLRNLEGGEDFDKKIEAVILHCTCLLVILSPDAVESRWVRSEIHLAFDHDIPIIPVMRRKTYPPVPINTLNYIECLDDDEQTIDRTLQAIQVRLYKLASDASPLAVASALPMDAPQPMPAAPDEPIPSAPGLPLPDPRLNALYLAGLEAAHAGDLEHANVLWQEILDQQPDFRSGQVEEELNDLRPRLRESRIRNARATAQKAMEEHRWQQAASSWNELLKYSPNSIQAHDGLMLAIRNYALESQQVGAWNAALGAWQTLLQHDPQDALAREYLPIAEANRSNADLYDDAVFFVQQGKPELARERLAKLWQKEKAPYYGDPRGIAPGLGLSVPPTLAQVKEEAARRAEAERKEREIAARAQAERDRIAKELADAQAANERRAAQQAAAERIQKEQAERDRIAKARAEDERRVAEQAQMERVQKERALAARKSAIAKRDELREKIYTLTDRSKLLKVTESTGDILGIGCGCAFVTAVPLGIVAAIIALVVNTIWHHDILVLSEIIAGALGVIVFVFMLIIEADVKRAQRHELGAIPDKLKPLEEQKSKLDDDIRALDKTIGDGRDPAEETFAAWQARKKKEKESETANKPASGAK